MGQWMDGFLEKMAVNNRENLEGGGQERIAPPARPGQADRPGADRLPGRPGLVSRAGLPGSGHAGPAGRARQTQPFGRRGHGHGANQTAGRSWSMRPTSRSCPGPWATRASGRSPSWCRWPDRRTCPSSASSIRWAHGSASPGASSGCTAWPDWSGTTACIPGSSRRSPWCSGPAPDRWPRSRCCPIS